jgi:hypothetical protein
MKEDFYTEYFTAEGQPQGAESNGQEEDDDEEKNAP